MTLGDLAQLVDAKIELWVTTKGEWGAGFVGGRVREGEHIISTCSGWGHSHAIALHELAMKLRGKVLIFDLDGKKVREFRVPTSLIA